MRRAMHDLATKKSKPKSTWASHSDPALVHETCERVYELRKPPPVITGWRLFCAPVTAAGGPLYLWARSEPASLARVRMALAGTCASNGPPDLSI